MSLTGKKALVIGGSSGIGLGIAVALAREGCQVAISSRSQEKIQAALARFAGDTPLWHHPCDVNDRNQVRLLTEWFCSTLGPMDILVHSAGINVPRRRLEELDPADFDRILATNCTGFFNILQAVLPGMRQRQDGLVVHISSIAGKRALPLAGPAYCASKFAATALAQAVGQEERAHGIRICNIHPGEVDTPLMDQRAVPEPAEKRRQMVHPEDIGACVVMLAKLPKNVVVPELIITPTYQKYL